MREFIGKTVYHYDRYWVVVDIDEWSEMLILEDLQNGSTERIEVDFNSVVF
jgi:hypothetical protein